MARRDPRTRAPSGLGEMTISPAGQVLANRPNYLTGRGSELLTREIEFVGPTNQFYFVMNDLDNNSGLRFLPTRWHFFRWRAAMSDRPTDAPARAETFIRP